MKPRLPLLLTSVLLGLMATSLHAAPVVNFFQKASSGDSTVSAASGADYWTVTTDNQKLEHFLPFLPANTKVSDLGSLSFTTRQGAGNNIYGNLYVNIYTQKDTGSSNQGSFYASRLGLETAYAKNFPGTVNTSWQTWTTDQQDSSPQLTVCDTSPGHGLGYPGAPTLGELTSGEVTMQNVARDYRNEKLYYITLNFNDSLNNFPGVLDLSHFNMTISGQAYQWNFVADDYSWNVSQSEGLGGTFDMSIVMQGGEAEALTPLLSMNAQDGVFTLNGGTQAIGADAEVSFQRFARTASQAISMEGAVIKGVGSAEAQTDAGLMDIWSTPDTPSVSISSSEFSHNTVASTGANTGYVNLFGAALRFTGTYDSDTDSLKTTLNLTNVKFLENASTVTFDSQYAGGTQGIVYLSAANAVMDQVVFQGNALVSAYNDSMGGAICSWGSDLNIKNSSFEGNSVYGADSGRGGAIYYAGGAWGGSPDVTAVIENSSFIGNSVSSEEAAQGGAIMLATNSKEGALFTVKLQLKDVLFSGNTVLGKTADMSNTGGAISVTNSDMELAVTQDMAYTGNAVLINDAAADSQGGFLYVKSTSVQSECTFNIASGKTLTIGEAGRTGYDSIAGTAGSLITKSGTGTLLVNSSMNDYAGELAIAEGTLDVMTGLASASQITIKGGAALYLGYTTLQNSTLSTTSGLSADCSLSAEQGSSLGTHLYNETADESWVITYDDLAASTKNAFVSYVGEDYQGYTYLLKGKISLTANEITPGDTINAGEGSTVDLGTSLPDNAVVISGGDVDASKVEGPLTDSQISGSSGNLITTENQEVIFTQTGESGFNVNGGTLEDGTVKKGASLVITRPEASEAEAPAVVLTGQYTSQNVAVKEGSLEIKGDEATLGVQGGTVVVGTPEAATEPGSSKLVNNATILSNVIVGDGSLLKGAGTFLGNVTLAQGARIYIGNSPGRMDIKDSTFTIQGNELTFCLGGYDPATKAQAGAGYYSNIHMEGGALQWNGQNTIVLDLGAGLLNTNTADVSFALITTDGNTQTTGINEESLSSTVITQDGPLAGLLQEGSTLSWDAPSSSLILSGTLNTAMADAILAEDGSRLANGLWSSTRSVGNFASVAVSQLDAPRNGTSNIWAAGLGDFSSISSTGVNNGFDYNGGGYALGGDYTFCKCFTGGLAFGQTFGTQKGDMGLSHIEQDGIMMALYGRATFECSKKTSFFLDGYFTYGDVENKGDVSLLGNTLSSHAKWHDNVFGGGLKAGWDIKMNDTTSLIPFIGIDYLRGEQDDLTLNYTGGSRAWYGGAMQTWTLPVGITLKKTCALGGEQYLIPELTVAYEGEIARQDPSIKTNAFGHELKTRGVTPGRSIFTTRAGMRWIMTRNWSASAYYTLETRSDMTNMGVNASVNYSF